MPLTAVNPNRLRGAIAGIQSAAVGSGGGGQSGPGLTGGGGFR